MRGPVFVDTNVLVYVRDATDPSKQARAAEWMAWLWASRQGRLSLQVLQEYYVTVTRKLRPGMDPEDARDDVSALRAWRPLAPDGDLLDEAWRLEDGMGIGFWDALVVAAAQRLGCELLLTEDLQDGRRIGGVEIRSPFTLSPVEWG
jgi:predicted nucleic acid-binding protein